MGSRRVVPQSSKDSREHAEDGEQKEGEGDASHGSPADLVPEDDEDDDGLQGSKDEEVNSYQRLGQKHKASAIICARM